MVLRRAKESDKSTIWDILQFAIAQRKAEGSDQWQDGYPNLQSIETDLVNEHAYVLEENGTILLYSAIIFGDDPAYKEIDGAWKTDQPYVVLHRVAVSPIAKGKGIATSFFKLVEELAIQNNYFSIRVDTNFDNIAMLRILEKLGYHYCGEVQMRGGVRKAFEKVLGS